jgi:hypothetical protein
MFIGQAHIAGSFKALALTLLVILLLIYCLEEKHPQPAEVNALGEPEGRHRIIGLLR